MMFAKTQIQVANVVNFLAILLGSFIGYDISIQNNVVALGASQYCYSNATDTVRVYIFCRCGKLVDPGSTGFLYIAFSLIQLAILIPLGWLFCYMERN